MKQFFSLLFSGLLFFSCAEFNEQPESPEAGESIQTRIRLFALDMAPVGNGVSTRADSNESNSLEVCWGGQTRATMDMTEAEKVIKKAWLLQFNGVATTSVLVGKPQALTLGADGYAECTLASGTQKVRAYILANVDEVTVNKLTTTTTLDAFEKTLFPQGAMSPADVATKGLPMFGYQEFIPDAGLPGEFGLSICMAKLTFQYTVGGVSNRTLPVVLRGIPNGVVCKTIAPLATSQQPAGATYTATYDLSAASVGAVTVYVPENLAGQKTSITQETDRGNTNAMANAMCIDLSNGSEKENKLSLYTHSIYLGDLAAHKGDFNVKSNTINDVFVNVKGNNMIDKRITVGEVYQNLNTQLDANNIPMTANCYSVIAAGNYYFDASVMGNGKVVDLPKNLASGSVAAAIPASKDAKDLMLAPVSADVLWETINTITAPKAGDIVNGVGLYGKKLLFKATATPGNAVIAVRDANHDIVWSWHIWRTASNPVGVVMEDVTDGAGFTASGLEVMDRNLGALNATPQNNGSIGLQYAWGRKDPLPGGADLNNGGALIAATTSFPVFTANPAVSLDSIVKTPCVFYKSVGEYGYDWTYRNDNLWGTPITSIVTINNGRVGYDYYNYNINKGSKTIYDPCPVGWRVPPEYAFVNILKGTLEFAKGYSFPIGPSGSPVWFPAGGKRYFLSASVSDIGGVGNYWASSSSSKFGRDGGVFLLESSKAGVNNAGRPQGCSVRCIKELN